MAPEIEPVTGKATDAGKTRAGWGAADQRQRDAEDVQANTGSQGRKKAGNLASAEAEVEPSR